MNSKKESTKAKKAKKRKNGGLFRYLFYDFVKITGAIPLLLWLRNKVYFIDKDAKAEYKKAVKGGALVACNHARFLDAVIIQALIWYRRVNTVAMKELFSTKFWSWFYTHILCISIDRDNVDVSSIKEVVTRLKEGKIVSIFPEGHINEGEDGVQTYKSGTVLMALMAKKPIIPVYLKKRKKFWHRQKIAIGKPVYLDGVRPTLPEIERYSAILQEKEVELFNLLSKEDKNAK